MGNLSFNTSEDELRQMFEPFGQVDRISIMTDLAGDFFHPNNSGYRRIAKAFTDAGLPASLVR